jgi:hypothetical protein
MPRADRERGVNSRGNEIAGWNFNQEHAVIDLEAKRSIDEREDLR